MNLELNRGRIDVADVLRGVAVMGIILLHCIEHFNFYSFPDTSEQGALLNFTDKAIWNGMFFAFGGKAYAIFALLFGFSFYIQDSKQQALGKDFRLRFCWRLVLLFVIGNINAVFFTGEVLVLYSIVGFVMPLVCRLSTKTLLIIACILLAQPMHIIYALISVFDADFVVPAFQTKALWGAANEMHTVGGFIEMAKVNLWEGQLASLAWAWDNARFFQSAALFIFGILIGRKGLFLETNLKFWYRTVAYSLLVFFPLYGLANMMNPTFIENPSLLKALKLVITSLSNFAFTVVLTSSIVIAYYNSKTLKKWLSKLIPYGRMSLTNYLVQSLVGAFIFYNWGLGLYDTLGITYSFLTGIVLFIGQYHLCRLWLSHFRQGPFEYLWKKATWINSKK
ncbi:MAG: DUF418 domain-containing protein [Rikenellaceae bacterium]